MAQGSHEAEPFELLYVPAMQLVQDPPSGPLDPTLHVQLMRASLPGGDLDWEGQFEHVLNVVAPEIFEYVFMAQGSHEAEPLELLYVPATQLVHDPPFGPLDPTLHVQLLRASLPGGDLDWEGQFEHVLNVVAPEVFEYVFLAQRSQVLEPEELLYLPAVQIVQGPPSGPNQPALHLQSELLILPVGEFEFSSQLIHNPE